MPVFSRGLRPTRRDLLLILITLSFAWLLLADHHRAAAVKGKGTSSLRTLFGKGANVLCGSHRGGGHATPYQDTVKKVGFVTPSGKGDPEQESFPDRHTLNLGHSPGWTLFERLYLFNGQLYIITDKRSDWPELRLLTSTGVGASDKAGGNEAEREPRGDEIIFRTPQEAYELWGDNVLEMKGTTYLWNDGRFLDHYYHFSAELLLSTWRVHASMDPDITATGETSLAPPSRAWFLHQKINEWRDGPRFNVFVLFGLFPNIGTLYPEDMADLGLVTRSEGRKKAYVFEHAILSDRSAAFRGPHTGPTARTLAGACAVNADNVSPWWWEPLRRQMLRFSGVDEAIINRNLEGFGAIDPVITEGNDPGSPRRVAMKPAGDYKPVVTYISRQATRRRLTEASHKDLVKALEEKRDKLGFELVIVEAEHTSKEEQIRIAARTTIMLGVHGNGLTHLLWMPATPRSAVIEMFYKGGFARDYQWTAHTLGIRHFAVQHDKHFTKPNEPKVDYPEGFQGSSITVVGQVVADLIEDRLTGKT